MAYSGGFSLGFSLGFDIYSGVLPSGVLTPPLMSQYWLNNFNKIQEITNIWNNS